MSNITGPDVEGDNTKLVQARSSPGEERGIAEVVHHGPRVVVDPFAPVSNIVLSEERTEQLRGNFDSLNAELQAERATNRQLRSELAGAVAQGQDAERRLREELELERAEVKRLWETVRGLQEKKEQ